MGLTLKVSLIVAEAVLVGVVIGMALETAIGGTAGQITCYIVGPIACVITGVLLLTAERL